MDTSYSILWTHYGHIEKYSPWTLFYTMTDNNKHLVLKGKHKNIWFVRKRVPKSIRFIVDKEFINESTKTSDIQKARERRDEILHELQQLEERVKIGEFDVLLNKFKNIDTETMLHLREQYVDELSSEYPWAGHPEQGNLPDPTESEMTKLEAMNVRLGEPRPEKHSVTLSTAMMLNFKYREDYSPTTLSNHAKSVKRFTDFNGGVDAKCKDIKRKNAKDFKVFLETQPKKLSNGTISRHFSDLSVIWKAGRDEEDFEALNPFSEHGIKVSKGKKPYLAWHHDDLRKVLDVLTRAPTDKLMVYVAWYTGSRLGECMSIRPEDIYQDRETNVWVVSIKPDREEQEFISRLDSSAKTEASRRIVPIHDELMEHLLKFKESNSGWARPSPSAFSHEFGRRKYLIEDPVNKVSKQYAFHSIRKNTATNFQRARVEESIAARLVGHSTVGATMTYGYYSEGDDFNSALKEINKLPRL